MVACAAAAAAGPGCGAGQEGSTGGTLAGRSAVIKGVRDVEGVGGIGGVGLRGLSKSALILSQE